MIMHSGHPRASFSRAYLDGEEIVNCVVADEEKGTILRYIADENGNQVPEYLYGVVTIEFDDTDFALARKTMRKELREDEGLFASYEANVAMLLYDNYNITDFTSKSVRDEAAKDILELVFGFNE